MDTLKIFKSNEDAKIPTRGSKDAAGYDLYVIEDKIIQPFNSEVFKTGIHMEIPNGMYGKIHPRSGMDIKHGIHPLAGVIDSDFLGEIMIGLYNKKNQPYHIKKGDRVAQIVFQKYETFKIKLVENLEELTLTERGNNGFGSTGY